MARNFWESANDVGQKLTGYDANTGQVSQPMGPAKDALGWGKSNAAGPDQTADSARAGNADFEAYKQAQDLKKSQLAIAKNMESSGYQDGIFNQFRNNRLKDLVSEQQSSKHRLAGRGLLYGGIAKGVEAKNAANAAYDLGQGKNQIKSAAEEQAKQIENDVLNQGLKQQQTAQQMNDVIYNSALKEYQGRRDSLKSLGAGLGSLVGTAYGGPAGGAAGGYAGGQVFS